MITDDELLAAVRSAGEPGSESHRRACQAYRRSVAEWQAASPAWQAEREALAGLARRIAEIAEAAREAGMLDDCGTYRGYNRHLREKTLVCGPCESAMREYKQGWYHSAPWPGTFAPAELDAA